MGSMGAGEFFGELALIRRDSARAADCIATQRTKVRASTGLSSSTGWPLCEAIVPVRIFHNT